jgi:hypothetical protein
MVGNDPEETSVINEKTIADFKRVADQPAF